MARAGGMAGGLPWAPVPSSPLCPQELSLLPLTEPTITANFSLFAPFGSSPINGKSQLRGAFGSAVLDSVPDYYSQLLTKVRGGGLFPCHSLSLIRGSQATPLCSPHCLPPEQPQQPTHATVLAAPHATPFRAAEDGEWSHSPRGAGRTAQRC